MFINNKKARTGHEVEVAIYGEPGAYVGLAGIDTAFFTMQAGNDLTYATVSNSVFIFFAKVMCALCFAGLNNRMEIYALCCQKCF